MADTEKFVAIRFHIGDKEYEEGDERDAVRNEITRLGGTVKDEYKAPEDRDAQDDSASKS